MKMPNNQSSENGLYDYEDTTYFSEGIENNGVDEFNPSPEDDFSEYLWMENEEEFDKEVWCSVKFLQNHSFFSYFVTF